LVPSRSGWQMRIAVTTRRKLTEMRVTIRLATLVASARCTGAATQRWREELFRLRHVPTADLLADFCARIDAEKGSLQPKDDLTIIVIEVA
ncbi:MAG: hypothetical protein ACREJC_09485, partial [Tepidisphaeraceae bacterium]